jgi:5-formaminoimidazole-4-carboxamide-1-(beta)-D-ribofuranosyl 5'-monophosphate synthetase
MSIEPEQAGKIVDGYEIQSNNQVTIGVLGSHSALEIGYGAREEDLEVLVVCERGRETTYTEHYDNLFDHTILLDQFSDMVKPEIQNKMRELKTIFVPNRSFATYVGYDRIEKDFSVPIFGNRMMLRAEERYEEKNQYDLLDAAGISRPKELDSPKEINSLSIVKVHEKERSVERAFFYASSYEEFKERSRERINRGIISEDALEEATIEEVALGGLFNANYFWSPLEDEIDLLGFDRRIQTDLDGLLRLPADEQLQAAVDHQNIEVGHYGATMRESQLEKVFDAGRKFVETCKEEYPPGMIGLFALQGVLTKELEFQVFDASLRVPGSPALGSTSPYMKYRYGEEVGSGKRTAREVKKAIDRGDLAKVVT